MFITKVYITKVYTVTESTKRNDEYFDFVKELDSIKRLAQGGAKYAQGAGGQTAAPPEYATEYNAD